MKGRGFFKTSIPNLTTGGDVSVWTPVGPLKQGDVIFITADEYSDTEMQELREVVRTFLPEGVSAVTSNRDLSEVRLLSADDAEARVITMQHLLQEHGQVREKLKADAKKFEDICANATELRLTGVVEGKEVTLELWKKE